MRTVTDICVHCGLLTCPGWCPKAAQPIGDWVDAAACADVPPATFEADEGDREVVDEAKRICTGCDVRSDCLEYALRNDMGSGVWGGKTASERRHQGKALLETLRRRRAHEQELGERD